MSHAAGEARFHPVEAEPGDVPEVGVGMTGYGFMGKAHANAYRKLCHIFWPPPARPRLVALCGRTEARVAEAARRYGYAGYFTDWRDLVLDRRVGLVDNVSTHDAHADPAVAALEAGKHVLCEKPMALDPAQARRMRDAAARSGARHMVAFNYRFAPAVQLARRIVGDGHLGPVRRLHISYLQDWQTSAAMPALLRPYPFGVLLGLGSHVVDLARFLVGEPTAVTGFVRTAVRRRPHPDGSGRTVEVTDDDVALAQVEFESGALGTLEASWVCAGRKNQLRVEVNGALGSLVWGLEDLNRLRVYRSGAEKIAGVRGFEDVLVTDGDHPGCEHWWPAGHVLGWEHLHANLIHHFVRAVATGEPVEPWGATFEDGYRAAVVGAAIEEASRARREVAVDYAGL